MKKIFLSFIVLILFSISAIAQTHYGTNMFMHVIGDTVDLKKDSFPGVVFLLRYGGSDNTGGGFFIRQDSTYPEGINAFDYPYSGYQWVRINLTDKYILPASSNYQLTLWNGSQYYPYTIAGVDSFKTSNTVDTLVNSTFTSTDKFHFTNWLPSYSATVDSVSYYYSVKTDTCFVHRRSSTGTFKSGGQFSWIRFK